MAQTTPAGSLLRRIGKEQNAGSGLIQPVTTHYARDGFLYVGEYGNGRILRFTVDGELVGWLSAVDDGLAQNRFRTSGTPVQMSTPGALNNPHATRIDADGFLYVTDTANNRLVKVRADGTSVAWLGKPDGGTSEEVWHTNGYAEKGTGPLELHNPYGLRLDNGVIYIADKQNFRIQIVRSSALGVAVS